MSATSPLWPARYRTVRTPLGSGVIDLRAVIVTGILAVLALGVGWVALTTGSSTLKASDVWHVLLGEGTSGQRRIVLEWRLPRVVFALLGGAALAVSGAVFQSITRNPLGSPDIIGFSSGAYTGALLMLIFGYTQIWAAPVGALVGGLATGLLVFSLASGRASSFGIRIIIVGIGVSMFLTAFNAYMLTVLGREQALAAANWGAGNLNDIAWSHVVPLTLVMAFIPVLAAQGRNLTYLEMGDDAAQGVGVAPRRVRGMSLVIAVALVAAVTAAAGPIAFVALAAPQIAMRLTGTSTVRIVPAATMGALMLASCDLLARVVVPGASLPAGVVTLCVGGAYLVWLLTGAGLNRSRRIR